MGQTLKHRSAPYTLLRVSLFKTHPTVPPGLERYLNFYLMVILCAKFKCRTMHTLCYLAVKELNSFPEQIAKTLGTMTQNTQHLHGSELCGRMALLEDGHCGASFQGMDRLETAETPEKLAANTAESQRNIFNMTWENPRNSLYGECCQGSGLKVFEYNSMAGVGESQSPFSIQKQSLTRGS